jgi:hypothetical protein
MSIATGVAPRSNLSTSKSFTLGADPEFFIMKKNRLLPAFNFLPPKDNGEKIKVYWDGFQAEFTMADVPTCIGLHGCDVHKQLRLLLHWVKKESESAKISMQNVVRIPDSLLKSTLDCHVALGCKPSENVYGHKGEHIDNGRLLKWRFAGGHMHFGGWSGKKMNPTKYVKCLDKILGIWSVGAAQEMDIPIRRRFYGLAGEFRNTFYPSTFSDADIVAMRAKRSDYPDRCGFEYRVLSNFYYCHPAIQQLTWQIARNAVTLAEEGYSDVWAADEEDVIQTINTMDVKRAKKMLERNAHLMDWMFKSNGWRSQMGDWAYKVGTKGVGVVVPEPDNIEDNWNLHDELYSQYHKFTSSLTWDQHVRNFE